MAAHGEAAHGEAARSGTGQPPPRIVVLAGVSGSGKSTVGAVLAAQLGWAFTDGDALHPAANIAKMATGAPLTDADRRPWLQAISDQMDDYLRAAQPAVIACSALKRGYRALLLARHPDARIVLLYPGRDALVARLQGRHGHFFPAALLDSQLAALELPQPGDGTLLLQATSGPDQLVRDIISDLHLAPATPAPGSTAPDQPGPGS